MICDLIIISVSELVKTVAIKQVKIFLLQTRIWSHLLPLWHPSIFPVIIENKSSDSPVNQYLTGYVLCYEYILSTPSTICHVQVLHYDTNILWILIWTRWTFFRVELVFECDFEISWTLDLGTRWPWDSWTSSFSSTSYFLLEPHISSSYWVLTMEIGIDYWRLTFDLYIDVEKEWWCSSFLLHSLALTSSHLLLIPPSYSTLLPNLLLPPP